jgi:hypothetical protein
MKVRGLGGLSSGRALQGTVNHSYILNLTAHGVVKVACSSLYITYIILAVLLQRSLCTVQLDESERESIEWHHGNGKGNEAVGSGRQILGIDS